MDANHLKPVIDTVPSDKSLKQRKEPQFNYYLTAFYKAIFNFENCQLEI